MKAVIRTGNNRGLALVSVIVAITILTIAFSMAASTFIGASKLTKQAADMTIASNFIEGVMERITAQPFDQVQTMNVTDGLPKLLQAKCVVNVSPDGNGLKQVVVTCSWLEGKLERKTRLSTLVAKGDAR